MILNIHNNSFEPIAYKLEYANASENNEYQSRRRVRQQSVGSEEEHEIADRTTSVAMRGNGHHDLRGCVRLPAQRRIGAVLLRDCQLHHFPEPGRQVRPSHVPAQ